MKGILKRIWSPLLLVAAGGAIVAATTTGTLDLPVLKTSAKTRTPPKITVDKSPLNRESKFTTSFAPIAKKVAPAVVNIYSTKTVKSSPQEMLPFNDPFFRHFFGDRFGQGGNVPQSHKERSLGSGVIVSKDGYILTNNHVVDDADEVKVTLAQNKRDFTAEVIGKDPATDVAVLKIDADDLPFVTLGDSDTMEVGDVVLAVGNPFGIGQTVTMGIVSAVGRGGMRIEDYEDFIQTDAAINPGNSGGALVDVEGRLIGINTAILSRTGGNNGIGFAIPVNMARNVMNQLIEHGKVVRGFLGVGIQDLDPDLAKEFNAPKAQGALVTQVTDGSAADKAGLKTGDVIVEFDGKQVVDSRNLKLMVGETAPDTKAEIKVLRDGKPKTFNVTLNEMPQQAAKMGSTQKGQSQNDALNGVSVGDVTDAVRSQFDIPSDVKGAVVVEVDPNSAAYDAGLRQGDVIQEINHKAVKDADDAVQATENQGGKRVLLRVWSNGGSHFLVVDESK